MWPSSPCTGYSLPARLTSTSWSPVALAGLIVSFLSLHIIGGYKKLNAAKFEVILKMEQYLPAAALGHEWELLREPPKGRAYWPVSALERHIYWVFAGLHVLLPLLVAVVLPLVGITDWPQLITQTQEY